MTISCTLVDSSVLTLSRPNRLANMYMLSPFVWQEDEGYNILVRAVPRRDDDPALKIAEIWYGRSADGRDFDMEPFPYIFPGPQFADMDGCEDPTVWRQDNQMYVWYSGYNAQEDVGRLILARGPSIDRLAKAGIVIDSRPPYGNPKEAVIAPRPDGGWRLFFEYARDGLSAIGMADADELDGPWRDLADAPLIRRTGHWDCGHMSPGAFIGLGSDQPIMFYNGATEDAAWRIGWAMFDRSLSKIVAQCDDPLVVPPTRHSLAASDIAFVASAIECPGGALLYYSVSDMDLRCAEVLIADDIEGKKQ